MQPEKAEEVRDWLRKAAGDLRGAQIDIAASPPLLEDALFHCQQASEKAMKALLTAHDVVFRRTHDLDELAVACERLHSDLRPALDPARELTVFAWRFRYPGEPSESDLEEAQSAFVMAQTVYLAITAHLPEDVQLPNDLWGRST